MHQFPPIRPELQETVLGIAQQEDVFTAWYCAKVNDLNTSTTTVSCVGMWTWQSWALIWWTPPPGRIVWGFSVPSWTFALCGKDLNMSSLLLSNMWKSNISLLFNAALACRWVRLSQMVYTGHRGMSDQRADHRPVYITSDSQVEEYTTWGAYDDLFQGQVLDMNQTKIDNSLLLLWVQMPVWTSMLDSSSLCEWALTLMSCQPDFVHCLCCTLKVKNTIKHHRQ